MTLVMVRHLRTVLATGEVNRPLRLLDLEVEGTARRRSKCAILVPSFR
jgi:hypothetical protein